MDHVETMRDMQEKWARALSSSDFADARRTKAGEQPGDYREFQRHVPTFGVKVDDSPYWDLVAKASRGPADAPDVIEYLMEQDVKKDTPNPVSVTTYGMDQAPVVTPNWINGEDLEKLSRMKIELHDLGDKYAAAEATMDAKSKTLWGQIMSLREKIDELSDSLAPTKEKDAQS